MLASFAISEAPAGKAARAPDASDILKRAEEVRSPDIDYAVDFTISVVDDYTPGQARSAGYSLIVHGKNLSMILMLTPEQFYGGTLLIENGAYWLLLPRASKPFQLSAEQVLRGDIANGDLARANLLADFEPKLDGEETIDGEPCWRLDLSAKNTKTRYSRIRCWVSRKGFLPRKFEYYGLTGALLKVARYGDYRKTPLGVRSMKLEIDSPTEMHRKTTMVFSDLRKIDPSPVQFTPEGMVAVRDAALAEQQEDGAQARLEDLLARLAAEKS